MNNINTVFQSSSSSYIEPMFLCANFNRNRSPRTLSPRRRYHRSNSNDARDGTKRESVKLRESDQRINGVGAEPREGNVRETDYGGLKKDRRGRSLSPPFHRRS